MESKTISTRLRDKANRLLEDGKVRHVKGGVVYRVEGDNDTYTVVLGYPKELTGHCTCPSTVEICSHILAACIDWQTDRELLLEAIASQVSDPV